MKSLILTALFLMAPSVFSKHLEGVLTQVYGDPQADSHDARINYYLNSNDRSWRLDIFQTKLSQQSIRSLLNQHVQVIIDDDQQIYSDQSLISVLSIEPDLSRSGLAPKAVILGTKPWVSVLCKFKDRPNETEPLNYFQNMYANLPAGLDHYWREVSYDQINVVGSNAYDWVTLPKNRDEYLDVNNDPDLSQMFDDCIAAVDALVDFSDNGFGQAYEGINMMFNDTFGCCAWGGGRYETLDGLSKLWRVTWNPPWAIHKQGTIAHEMGHGFGLPHANNSDGDSNPYDSPWDVMSSSGGYSVNDPVYGLLGKHINMSYKYNLGWVTDAVGFVANPSSQQIVTLEYTAKASSPHPRFIRIPLSNGTNYFVEVRKKVGNYEANLPGNAVIVHHVDWNRNEPAWVVDGDNPPANYADTEGVMWKVGETFYDARDGYQVSVLAVTTDGFQIQINGPYGLPDLIFADGFESP